MKRTLSFWRGSRRRPRLLVVAGLAFIASTYGLVRLAYGLFLPDVQADLGLGDRAAGYVSSGASLAYCLGAVVGLAADRRPRTVLVVALLTGVTGAAGTALAPGSGTFAVAAVLASSSAGLASPALVAVVDRVVAAERRDRAQAVVNSGTGPGLVAAGLLAVVLLPDWRAGFAAGAVATLVCGGLVLLLAHGGAGAPAAPERPETRGTTRAGARRTRCSSPRSAPSAWARRRPPRGPTAAPTSPPRASARPRRRWRGSASAPAVRRRC
ncbi:MFS transporter [Nocardioides zeae]